MEPLKVDKTKLVTVQNYAVRYKVSRPTVYKMIESKELKVTKIDGVTFIDLS